MRARSATAPPVADRRRGAAIALAIVLALALVVSGGDRSSGAAPGAARDGYRIAEAPYRLRFPRDHASHPEFRTEWWYYTGHLRGAGRSFGYELTFFRVGVSRERERSRSAWAPHTLYFSHLALTDEDRRSFRFHEAAARPALGRAGADTARYHVWLDDGSARLGDDGRTHELAAAAGDLALRLAAVPLKPPAVHGVDGVTRKGGAPGATSHYYSLTRLATRGWIRTGRDSIAVEGESWMDHEFGSGTLDPDQTGWDWFSLQLDDGRELMLYLLRRRDGRIEPLSTGTLVARDGSTRRLAPGEFEVAATGRWKSRATGGVYPQGWRIHVPSEQLRLELAATVPDQELVASAMGGIAYWEGSVRVRGTARGRTIGGAGYVELTGYVGAPPGVSARR